jgi:D-arabinose 1-dehydrogenase-like Zn-dependent alcohol dehydrogenase
MEHPNPHSGNYETMKAVEFDGKPFSMKVKTLPIPKITQPTDAVIRVTSSGICGTDLRKSSFLKALSPISHIVY